jgi:hypothetical protein
VGLLADDIVTVYDPQSDEQIQTLDPVPGDTLGDDSSIGPTTTAGTGRTFLTCGETVVAYHV